MFDLPPNTYSLTRVQKRRGNSRRFELIGLGGDGALAHPITSENPSSERPSPPPTRPDVERPPDGNAGAPENLAATWDAGDVLLVWEHPTPGGDFVFVMERSDNEGLYTSIEVLDSSTLMTTDSPVFGSVFSYRVKTVNSVGSSDYSNVATITIGALDTAETYSEGALNGLDGEFGWVAAWVDDVLAVGITDFESAEEYANTDSLNAKPGGVGWLAAWVDASLFIGLIGLDSAEEYSDSDPLSGLNGGSGFSGAWTDVTLG